MRSKKEWTNDYNVENYQQTQEIDTVFDSVGLSCSCWFSAALTVLITEYQKVFTLLELRQGHAEENPSFGIVDPI